MKGRLARYGRRPDDLKILPATTVDPRRHRGRGPASGPHHIRLQQVSPQGAIAFLEQVWGRDLSGYDPEGPLPDVDPDVEGSIDHHAGGSATSVIRSRWPPAGARSRRRRT